MIESPVLIIGCARSGTSLLYNVLAEAPALWSIGGESKAIIERYHAPAARGWESGALGADDLTAASREWMVHAFAGQAAPGAFWGRLNGWRRRLNRTSWYTALKRYGRGNGAASGLGSAVPQGGLDAVRSGVRLYRWFIPTVGPIRLLEKTPENCLRLPFLQALFPDARIIYLVRDGRANVASLLEGWRQPRVFPGYQTPVPVTAPGQTRGRWAFTLIPGWRELVNRPLEEICARQWVAGNAAVLDYLALPDSLPALIVRYEDLVAGQEDEFSRIAQFIGLSTGGIPGAERTLPEINSVSRPGAEKWRAELEALGRVAPIMAPMMERLGYEV